MTKEIRSPNVENSQLYGRRFQHSDFVIPSDFLIRHSDLRIAVCSIKRPVSGLVRSAGGGLVHGESGVFLRSLKNQSIKENHMQKITPFLWFDNQAEAAVKFYTSIFKNSRIGKIARYGEEGEQVSGRPKESVMTVEFQLEGQQFVALNGGPRFKFTEAISFVVNCKSQEEVDYFWGKLTSDGGQESQCGWLKDKYGLSWQVVPTILIELFKDKDAEKSQRVMKAMLQMKKIDISKLKQAYEQAA